MTRRTGTVPEKPSLGPSHEEKVLNDAIAGGLLKEAKQEIKKRRAKKAPKSTGKKRTCEKSVPRRQPEKLIQQTCYPSMNGNVLIELDETNPGLFVFLIHSGIQTGPFCYITPVSVWAVSKNYRVGVWGRQPPETSRVESDNYSLILLGTENKLTFQRFPIVTC